jgi:hypothetical protein
MDPKALGRIYFELTELARRFPPQLRNFPYEQMASEAMSELVASPRFREREAQINDLLASTSGFEHFDLTEASNEDQGAAYEFVRRVANVIEWVANDTSQPYAFVPAFQVYPGLPIYVERASSDRLMLRQSPLQKFYERFRIALETLDPSRIRLCEACNAIFWVHRKNQAACSKPCANRARVRRWYAKPEHAERVKLEKRKSRERSADKTVGGIKR